MAAAERRGQAHGGLDLEELRRAGIAPQSVLDFSVNVNPYGPTSFMRDAIRNAPIERYPDPAAALARQALARAWGVAPETVVLGSGAAELLWLVVRALVREGDHVVVAGPTFSEAGAAAAACRAVVSDVTATSAEGFHHDPGRLIQAVRERAARLVYLCAPNNPTGVAWPVEEIAAVVRRCPEATFIVDQSFLSLSERHEEASIGLPDNALRVRSLTKDHAIPGVRVGALIATPVLARTLENLRPFWSTSAAVQAAAIAAAAEQGFVAESRARLLDDREGLAEGLRALGLSPLPSSTIYLLVDVGNGASVRATLLHQDRILVRDCASFGLPHHLRLAARPATDRARLLAALRRSVPVTGNRIVLTPAE